MTKQEEMKIAGEKLLQGAYDGQFGRGQIFYHLSLAATAMIKGTPGVAGWYLRDATIALKKEVPDYWERKKQEDAFMDMAKVL